MPYALAGRNVLITGGSRGLGAVVARKFAAEGCNVAVNYVSRETAAKDVAEALRREFGIKTIVIQGDAGIAADCERCVKDTIDAFGGLDILIGNAGWTKFATNWTDLHALSDEDWDKCWAVNVKGQMALLRAALPTFNHNPDGGVFIITSSVAAITTAGSSLAYSVSKAAGIHLMKSLAQTQGPKVRVNAVLPGLLLTEWVERYPNDFLDVVKEKAALKSETSLDDCADAFVMIAKNSSMTGQKVQVDAGLYIAAM